MSGLPRILFVNPTITSRRSARFPLSLLSVAASLEGRASAASSTATPTVTVFETIGRTLSETRFDAVGVSVIAGPQVHTGYRRFARGTSGGPGNADYLGWLLRVALHESGHECLVC